MPRPMDHLVVVVPGILGSVLRKNGRMIWGFPEGVRGLLQPIATVRGYAAELELGEDHSTKPYLDDNVRATALISMPQVIANFFKVDGYDRLRERLFEDFQLEPVTLNRVGNYLEFPYDWRRDNRSAAHRLHAEVEAALTRWREHRNKDAKVIYICHSMGGLVARYHLEVLGGWKNCLALITLATPHRGAVNALQALVQGTTTAGVNLAAVVRKCTSVYQLLPTYPMVDVDNTFHRVAERADLPDVSQASAQDALRFHHEIREAVAARPKDAYPLFYFSGVAQPTLQSATLQGAHFKAENFAPDGFPTYLETGDGTVPLASSIPLEQSEDPRGGYVIPTCHAMMQSSDEVWAQINQIMNRLQTNYLTAVCNPSQDNTTTDLQSIEIELKDVTTSDPWLVRARLLNPKKAHQLEAELELVHVVSTATVSVTANDQPHTFPLPALVAPHKIGPFPLRLSGESRWELSITGLPEGTYRVKVQTHSRSAAPIPAEDVFEIAR